MKAKKEVGFGVGGRVTTLGRPLHDGDVLLRANQAVKMVSSIVEFGVGGGGSTHFWPPQSGISQSWVPKKGTIAESHDHGVFSQSEHCGVIAIGVRSSEGASGVISDVVRETSGAVEAIIGANASTTGRKKEPSSAPMSSDLNGVAPASSNPVIGSHRSVRTPASDTVEAIIGVNASSNGRETKIGFTPTSSELNGAAPASSYPAIGTRPKSSPGSGKSFPSPINLDEHARRGSGLVENGYVHFNTDFPATIDMEMANVPPVKSWKSLVSMPVKTGGPLQFYEPHYADGKLVAKPPVEAVNEGIDMWKGCLVGQFLDRQLPFLVVRSLVNRLWGKREMPKISTTENGLLFFRFRDPEARDWVMDAGPWHLAGRPFILRAWKPGMDMLNIQLSSIPIWVRFYNIPLEYWTSTCLGHIASTIGIPLHLDPLTENQTKLSFARICIEVGVGCEFPKSVLLDRGNGSYSTIRTEYPWVPQCCSECKLFGHNLLNCQAKKRPSSGMISTILGNSKHEAVNGMEVDEVGEGLKMAAGSSICAVANPIVMHAAAEMPTMSDSPIVMHAAAEMPTISDSPVAHEEAGFSLDAMDSSKATEVEAPTKLHGNTFACLAQNEEEDPNEEEGPLPTPTAKTDFSDTSPIIDTFRHRKRVDELDFTPVPLSRKKLKKLKKRSPVNSLDPGIRGTLPNG